MSEALVQLGALKVPSGESLNQAASVALDLAKSVVIVDDVSYGIAGDELREIKGKKKALQEKMSAIVDPINKGLREIRALFSGPIGLLDEAEGVIKSRMLDFATAREREAAAARRAAEEAARKVEPDNIIDMLEASAVAPAVPIAPKAAGISKVKTTIKARVVDKRAFLAHVAADQSGMLLDMIEVSDSKLSALVRATGGAIKIPGVETFEEKSIAARAA